MKPRSGENPPLRRSSRSQSCRPVRSHEGNSRDCAFSSVMRSGCAMRSMSSPPCGAIRWLAVVVKTLDLPVTDTDLQFTALLLEIFQAGSQTLACGEASAYPIKVTTPESKIKERPSPSLKLHHPM